MTTQQRKWLHFAALDLPYLPPPAPHSGTPRSWSRPCPVQQGDVARRSRMRAMPRRSYDGVALSIPGLLPAA